MEVRNIGLSINKTLNKQNIPFAQKPIQTPSVSSTIKDNKKGIITASIALALLGVGIYAHKQGLIKKITQTNVPDTLQLIKEKITQIKTSSMNEIERIIKENTAIDGIKLDVIDNAACIRSADKTQPERFHQAATWIEEAYKKAYSQAKLQDNNNMLNYIHNRINTENNALAKMYAQIPTEEAQLRAKLFAQDVAEMDIHKGMTPQKFVEDMFNTFIPKAKEDLKAS